MLVSLVLLWGFAAWVTVGDGWNLLQAASRDQTAGRPSKTLITVLQEERRAALANLGARRRGGMASGLAAQQAHTDQAIAVWRRSAHKAEGAKIKAAVRLTDQRLRTLASARAAAGSATTDRDAAARPYNDIIDAAFAITAANAQLDDQDVSADGRALIALTRARELLSREDAYLASVIGEGRFGPGELIAFGQTVGITRHALQEVSGQLPPDDQSRLRSLMQSTVYTQLRDLENRVLQQPTRTRSKTKQPTPGLTAVQWQAATRPMLSRLDETIDIGGDAVVKRAEPVGYGVLARLVIVAGLGLLAVVTSIVLAFTTSRTLLRQLHRLQIAATELAEHSLPAIMERLSRGEKVDVAAEAPPLAFGDDEIGRVGKAFNQVRESAIAAAVKQAELRRGSASVQAQLARRTQSLVVQAHKHLDELERREDLADQQELYGKVVKVDEIVTRLGRQAVNALVATGEVKHQSSRRPLPLLDVIRAAMGAVEGYERIELTHVETRWLNGRAYDLPNLFAALLENALSYSQPDTSVTITTTTTANGLAVEIQDKGLGMSSEQLAHANQILASPPPFDAIGGGQLGHLVVGMIAQRHGITVTLQPSAYGGVQAVVLLPNKLFEQDPPQARDRSGARNLGTTPAAGSPSPSVQEQQPRRLAPVAVLPNTEDPAPADDDLIDQRSFADPRPRPVPAAAPIRAAGNDAVPNDVAPVQPQTPGGLPVRTPQASLAPQLQTDVSLDELPEEEDSVLGGGRSAEDVRSTMSAFQRGTQQGRADASQDSGETGEDALRHDPGTRNDQ
ncbi:nitrate- and nitrite sensing domain-containing protein [Spirillospora sp. NPDC050679]